MNDLRCKQCVLRGVIMCTSAIPTDLKLEAVYKITVSLFAQTSERTRSAKLSDPAQVMFVLYIPKTLFGRGGLNAVIGFQSPIYG